MKFRRNKKGFTIVELVIVIGVIGILSAILIPTFASLNAQAERAQLQSNLHNAFSMYAADAADGKVDDAETSSVDLIQKNQTEIRINTAIDGDGIWYKWNESRWEKLNAIDLAETHPVSTPNQKYLSYYMFY